MAMTPRTHGRGRATGPGGPRLRAVVAPVKEER